MILGLIPSKVAARQCCQQCLPRVNAGQLEAPSVGQAGNKLFHSNQIGAFVRCPSLILPLPYLPIGLPQWHNCAFSLWVCDCSRPKQRDIYITPTPSHRVAHRLGVSVYIYQYLAISLTFEVIMFHPLNCAPGHIQDADGITNDIFCIQ